MQNKQEVCRIKTLRTRIVGVISIGLFQQDSQRESSNVLLFLYEPDSAAKNMRSNLHDLRLKKLLSCVCSILPEKAPHVHCVE
jgi:hypothetical protein